MDYTCRHCKANLDKGDIFEYYLDFYNLNVKKALEVAATYGWSETNRIHFNRSVIVQPDKGPQYIQCPDCKKTEPFNALKVHLSTGIPAGKNGVE